MGRTIKEQDIPTAQVLYNNLKDYIKDIEDDVYGLEDLFVLLGQTKAFLEANYEVE